MEVNATYVLWFVKIIIKISQSTICRFKTFSSYYESARTTVIHKIDNLWVQNLRLIITRQSQHFVLYIIYISCVGGTILLAIACCKMAISRIIKLQLVNLNACIFSEAWRPCRIFTLKVLGMHSSRLCTWCWYEQLYLQF